MERAESATPDYPSSAQVRTAHHHGVLAEWSVDEKNPNRINPSSRTRSVRAIFTMPAPAARSWQICSSISSDTFGRPSCFPLALARALPEVN